jgi:hypothetical protein
LTAFHRIIPLAAFALFAGTSLAAAQTNNPGNAGGAPGSRIAVPTYPKGYSDPAESPGRLQPGSSGVQADRNPNVAGATGSAVVPGDQSSIRADRRATTEQKTGGASSEGAN